MLIWLMQINFKHVMSDSYLGARWCATTLILFVTVLPMKVNAEQVHMKNPDMNYSTITIEADQAGAKDLFSRSELVAHLSTKEKEWFKKFYEGVFVFVGWQEITDSILARYPLEERAEGYRFIKQLGFKIGSEWCRDNSVRKIDTTMLKTWGNRLRQATNQDWEQLTNVLEEIDNEVDRVLR